MDLRPGRVTVAGGSHDRGRGFRKKSVCEKVEAFRESHGPCRDNDQPDSVTQKADLGACMRARFMQFVDRLAYSDSVRPRLPVRVEDMY